MFWYWVLGVIIGVVIVLPITLGIIEHKRNKFFSSTKSKNHMTQEEKDEMLCLDAEVNLRKQLMRAEMKKNMDR
ncbi:MAG: hypothetical protein CVV58_06205, partial [Tenericutes bacterium HGW-Tenericutes-3]